MQKPAFLALILFFLSSLFVAATVITTTITGTFRICFFRHMGLYGILLRDRWKERGIAIRFDSTTIIHHIKSHFHTQFCSHMCLSAAKMKHFANYMQCNDHFSVTKVMHRLLLLLLFYGRICVLSFSFVCNKVPPLLKTNNDIGLRRFALVKRASVVFFLF